MQPCYGLPDSFAARLPISVAELRHFEPAQQGVGYVQYIPRATTPLGSARWQSVRPQPASPSRPSSHTTRTRPVACRIAGNCCRQHRRPRRTLSMAARSGEATVPETCLRIRTYASASRCASERLTLQRRGAAFQNRARTPLGPPTGPLRSVAGHT